MATTTSVATKELVKYRVEDGVAIFELDDAPANTYTYDMMLQLDAAILKARMDESAHVIVIRGAGEKFFSAGASIPMLSIAPSGTGPTPSTHGTGVPAHHDPGLPPMIAPALSRCGAVSRTSSMEEPSAHVVFRREAFLMLDPPLWGDVTLLV